MRSRLCQAFTPTQRTSRLALWWQAETFNNDDLIDLWSGDQCMSTGLPFRETPVGSDAPSLEGAIAGKARNKNRCLAPAKPGLIRIPTGETMTFGYWMLIAAAMMPYLTIALAKSPGGIDNRAPRLSLERLSGWRQRADWAHRNHFEAFPTFAAAVFVAELTHAPQNRIDQLAGIFVLLRVIYTALYIADQATLRSIVWSLGLITVLWLFVLGV
jgi:uncharacterized MAPEG superfamily protein